MFLSAQISISGVVKDSSSLAPLQFVSILLKESYVGSLTDENGAFNIKIEDNENAIILFRIIGYYDQEVSIRDLKKDNTVYLSIKDYELSEVVFRPVNAYDLLQEVVRKIPKNYYSEPIGQEVFFRQIMHTNGELNILEEGHFDILNSFRKDKLPKNVSVHKARGFVDLEEYADLGRIIANNIDDDSINIEETAEILLAFNPNQKSFLEDDQSIFSENAKKLYDISYQGLIEKDGNVCYFLTFDQKEGLKKTLFKGVFYIDTATMAITEFQASLSPEGLDYQKFLPLKIRMLIRIAGFKISIKNIAYYAKYEWYNDYWVIKEGSFHGEGGISRGKGAVLNGSLSLNYYVDHNYPKQSFYNRSSPYAVIASDALLFKDLEFWQSSEVYMPKLNVYIQKLLNQKIIAQ